jgi:hypothetical protein
MYKVIPVLLLVLIACSFPALTQDNRAKIKDYLDHEILIVDRFAGQSITLIKEKQDYYIERKIFGSGRPVVAKVKYKVVFNSDYQITFSEIADSSSDGLNGSHNEVFLLCSEENGISLYLNQLKVVTVIK